MRKIALLAVIAGLASSPASAQNREHLQMAAELRILQQQNQELAAALTQAIQLLNETSKALNSRIDQTNELMRKGFADQGTTLNTAAGDARKTLAQTQDLATRLGELKEEVTSLRTSLPAMISRLASANAAAAATDPDAGLVAAPPATGAAPSASDLSPQRMYEAAFNDYAAGLYTQAIAGFTEFLKTYPTSARAPQAQFQIGESELAQSRFEQAVAAYSLVIQNHPKSDQVPWAYYRRGLAQRALRQVPAARASFETVVKQFPESEPAVLALSQLQSLDTPSAPATPPRRP
ncbi:MAG TPA: tol-pal system protein YbgF [Vicinamibacterales bacterium]|nr:tol-pal system protein YbgF [Vicinamibacterales bacterium]